MNILYQYKTWAKNTLIFLSIFPFVSVASENMTSEEMASETQTFDLNYVSPSPTVYEYDAYRTPNTVSSEFSVDDSHIYYQPKATSPREKWEHYFPLGADQVILNGYDLPLPMGVSLIMTRTIQEHDADNLNVGFVNIDGLSGVNIMADGVAQVERFETDTSSPQLKFDVWVLPMVNLYATVGYIQSDIEMDLRVDGAGAAALVDQATADCNRFSLCSILGNQLSNYLEDKSGTFYLKDGNFDGLTGYNYTLGMLVAGAVGDWFYVMPISYTQARMSRSKIEGRTFNVQPRIGYNYKFAKKGSNIATYVGFEYMDTKQTISGEIEFSEITDGDDESFSDKPGTSSGPALSWEIDQENKDKVTGIIGFQYAYSGNVAFGVQYSGIGKAEREQFLVMFNTRF